MKTPNDWFCGRFTSCLMELPLEEESRECRKRQADEFEQVRKKVLKKTRRKKTKEDKKVKSEYIMVEESCMDNGEETNYESEDEPVSAASTGDSLANNCILNEILSEKKRALLESPEMIEFLQSRIRTS